MGSALEDAFGWATGQAGRLDWAEALAVLLVGLAVAGVAVAAALAAAYYLGHGPLPGGAGGSVAARGIRRWHRARGTADRERWLCGRCRSWNAPSTETCYRGCGPREVVRMLLPGDVGPPSAVAIGPEGLAPAAEDVPSDPERPF